MFELTFFLSSLESRLVSGSFWLESDTQRETHIFLTGKDLLIVLLLLRSSHCVRTFFWQSLANLPSEIWKNKNYCAESLTGSCFFWWIGEAWIVEPLWILKIMHRVSVIKKPRCCQPMSMMLLLLSGAGAACWAVYFERCLGFFFISSIHGYFWPFKCKWAAVNPFLWYVFIKAW